MSKTFLPEEYKIPTVSNYFKFREGANKFRILGSAIIGYEYWNKENRPVRLKTPPSTTPTNIRMEKDQKTGQMKATKIKHFWAFPVWNYEQKRVQVMEITQGSIQEGIKALVDNEEWGDPKEYNLVITRSGEGFDTSYVVQPSPKAKLPIEIGLEYDNMKLNLEALFEGKDPFSETEIDEEDKNEDVPY